MTVEKRITFVAVTPGFYDGGRVRQGETFVAPASFKAKWAKPGSPGDVIADTGGEPGLLDKSAREIVPAIAGLSDNELSSMIAAEGAGKKRKAVLAAFEDERANRIGRVGGPPPNKQPEEKEPTTAPAPDGADDDLTK